MRVLITGANGFVGKNLRLHLTERKNFSVVCFDLENLLEDLPNLVAEVDFVVHLAGVNRPKDPKEFFLGNTDLTKTLCDAIASVSATTGKKIPVIYSSSIQADRSNAYGQSKLKAEDALRDLSAEHGVPVFIFRLPNLFGKWCRPNYNSVVATFCYNISRGLPITLNDPTAPINLVYVDDVVTRFIDLMEGAKSQLDEQGFDLVSPQYLTSVGELLAHLFAFRDSRLNMITERVGSGFLRALYATYLSYIPTDSFSYTLPQHSDSRGVFVEMLKTKDSGQFSYFTAHPGITRGGHYHHTKTEKFLVIKGEALFKFRHMDSGESFELVTKGDKAEIVETVPGWTHSITNIGSDEMIVMLWANEIFDRESPDTFAFKL